MRSDVLRKIVLVAVAAALSSCGGDPAAEEPVKVRPGLYEAKMSAGFGPFSVAASEQESRSCVTEDETEHFPQVFTRKYLSMDGQCDGPLSERKGNLVTGKLTCPADDERTLTINYTAKVRAESVDVDVKGEMTAKPSDLEETTTFESKLSKGIDLGVKIKRVGDC